MPVDPPLSRRALLATGTVTFAALSACTADGEQAPTGSASPAGDPDEQLVDTVVAQIGETLAEVTSARAAAPTLRSTIRHLVRMHQAHLAALEGTPPGVTGPVPTFDTPESALAAVRRREARLQRQLAAAALQAESGGLARLLASMSAAVSQSVAVV